MKLMDWLDNLQKAINYIEEHLLEDEMITDMNISHEIYSSTDSFRTIFRVITGYSVGEYIRNGLQYFEDTNHCFHFQKIKNFILLKASSCIYY